MLRARLVAYGWCGLILVVALFQWEVWPLSAFRLFSDVRTSEQVTWELRVVDDAGLEHPVALSGLPESHSGSHQILPLVASESSGEQRAIVLAYARAGGLSDQWLNEHANSARIYRVTTTLEPDGSTSAKLEEVTTEVPLP